MVPLTVCVPCVSGKALAFFDQGRQSVHFLYVSKSVPIGLDLDRKIAVIRGLSVKLISMLQFSARVRARGRRRRDRKKEEAKTAEKGPEDPEQSHSYSKTPQPTTNRREVRTCSPQNLQAPRFCQHEQTPN